MTNQTSSGPNAETAEVVLLLERVLTEKEGGARRLARWRGAVNVRRWSFLWLLLFFGLRPLITDRTTVVSFLVWPLAPFLGVIVAGWIAAGVLDGRKLVVERDAAVLRRVLGLLPARV